MSRCSINDCKVSIFNKPPGVNLHACPISTELRSKWHKQLQYRCSNLDWNKSRICSRHFENKYFDNKRRLQKYAIPTLFPSRLKHFENTVIPRTKVEKLLKSYNQLSQVEILADLQSTLNRLEEPSNVNEYITEDLKCKTNAPLEVKLWLQVKKQQSYSNKLIENMIRNKQQWENVKKTLDDTKANKKQLERNLETYKYIVKCLQEKQASLEEQIEILTAVESI